MKENFTSNISGLNHGYRDPESERKVVDVAGIRIGGHEIIMMAGPCAVENEEQLMTTAKEVRDKGAKILRGGAFKPRSSPYDFQGLGEEGLKLLDLARKMTGMPIVTEVMDPRQVELVCRYSNILQIGSRNMNNYPLLKEVGQCNTPVLFKRGMSSTVKEYLLAAEYVLKEGNKHVILCERGIRTFENSTRNTLDLSAVPMLKQLSNLPVIVDPSHATGIWWMVPWVSKAAVAVGADGLLVEVHYNPEVALCDGPQSLRPDKFARMMKDLQQVAQAVGRTISCPDNILVE